MIANANLKPGHIPRFRDSSNFGLEISTNGVDKFPSLKSLGVFLPELSLVQKETLKPLQPKLSEQTYENQPSKPIGRARLARSIQPPQLKRLRAGHGVHLSRQTPEQRQSGRRTL